MHRDLKPENFLTGLGKKEGTIYLIDFGIAKKYIDSETGKHIKQKTDKKFIGAARYASLDAHLGNEQSRRDDLESLGYIMIYMLRGFLPWQGMEHKPGEELERAIFKKKSETTLEQLCEGLPDAFLSYMKYVKGLGFTQDPDYDYLVKLLETLQKKDGPDSIIDWSILKKVCFEDAMNKIEDEITKINGKKR